MKIIETILTLFPQIYTTTLLLKCYDCISNNIIVPNKKKKIVYIIIFSLCLSINNVYNLIAFKTISAFLIILIMNLLIYRDKIKTVLINTIILVFTLTSIELIISIPLIINSSIVKEINTLLLKIMLTVIVVKITEFLLKTKKIKSIIDICTKFLKQYFHIKIVLFFSIIIINILLFYRSKYFDIYYIAMFIMIIFGYITITIYEIIKSKIVIDRIKEKNIELYDSYVFYSNIYENDKILKHNLKNDLYSLKVFLQNDKQEEINKIINKYVTNSNWINDLEKIPEGLQGLLYLKTMEAQKLNVSLLINYYSKNKIKSKDLLDLCTILGICVDNSIEATKKIKNRVILLDVYDKGNLMLINIVNPFNNKIDLNSIGDLNYSTKEKKSGIGLNYIKKVRNKKIYTKIKIQGNLFIVSIKYKCK